MKRLLPKKRVTLAGGDRSRARGGLCPWPNAVSFNALASPSE